MWRGQEIFFVFSSKKRFKISDMDITKKPRDNIARFSNIWTDHFAGMAR